jgi:hypothetical protein
MSNKINTTIDGLEFVNDAGRRVVIRTNHGAESDQYIDLPSSGGVLSTGGGADGNDLVKVSSNDTTAGYLNGKLVAGANITFTEGSDGGNETLTIAASGGGGGGSSNLTEYTVTTADAENTTSQVTVATFTVPANTWEDGDVVWLEYRYLQLELNGADTVGVVLSCTGLSDLTSTLSGTQTSQQSGQISPIYKRIGSSLYTFRNSTSAVQTIHRPSFNSSAFEIAEYTSFDFTQDIVVAVKVTHSLADPSNYVRTIFGYAAKASGIGMMR